MTRWGDRWPDSTVVVLASGPSLTAEDIEAVRAWRESEPNRYVIVTNTTFRAAPWADVLFFNDAPWWKVYKGEVRDTFAGEKATIAAVNAKDVSWLRGFDAYGNSGAGAMALAALAGAKRIIGLGIDCKYIDGKRHWHGDHPSGLGNARSVKKWERHFDRLLRNHDKVEILNASRDTDLQCLPRVELEAVL